MKSRILCITAGQRAGTTALHSALAGTGKFSNFGEIFQETNDLGAGYLQYCKDNKVLASDILTNANAKQHVRSYIDFIIERAGSTTPLVDVKFNSWLTISPIWRYIHQCPYFMNHLISYDTTFLIIRREDLAAQVMSEQIARSVDKWHNLEGNEVPKELEVDVEWAQWQAQLIAQTEQFLITFLKGKLRTICVTYENLYHDEAINSAVLDLLQERFKIELPSPLFPKFHKNAGDKSQIIANYDKIKTLIDEVLLRFPRPDIPDAGLI